MTSRLDGFDKIAWVYDPLARLVFGNRLLKAQTIYLHCLKPNSRVLVLGGGTGAILEALFKVQPACHVTYIDASGAMLKRASQRRVTGQVEYIHGDERSIPERNHDAVITPFYLDVFDEPGLALAIQRISARLVPGALWIAADFYPPGGLWERLLMSIMYSFFRITTGIKAKALPDWRRALQLNGWVEAESQADGFIGSAVFRRQS